MPISPKSSPFEGLHDPILTQLSATICHWQKFHDWWFDNGKHFADYQTNLYFHSGRPGVYIGRAKATNRPIETSMLVAIADTLSILWTVNGLAVSDRLTLRAENILGFELTIETSEWRVENLSGLQFKSKTVRS